LVAWRRALAGDGYPAGSGGQKPTSRGPSGGARPDLSASGRNRHRTPPESSPHPARALIAPRPSPHRTGAPLHLSSYEAREASIRLRSSRRRVGTEESVHRDQPAVSRPTTARACRRVAIWVSTSDPSFDSFGQLLDLPAAGMVLQEVSSGDDQREWPFDEIERCHRPIAGIPGQRGTVRQVDPGAATGHRYARRVAQAVKVVASRLLGGHLGYLTLGLALSCSNAARQAGPLKPSA
jgi:hypothetical protein